MNEMINIKPKYMSDGMETNTVNARELAGKLDVGKDFSTWVKDQISRARLLEGQDFIIVTPEKGNQKGRGGDRRSKDYFLTLDAAKHIAMVSGCTRGHEIRQYFIDFEKRHTGQPVFQIPANYADALRFAADTHEKLLIAKGGCFE